VGRADEFAREVTPALAEAVSRAIPGARLVRVVPLAADRADADETLKAAGYGVPLRLEVEAADRARRTLVFHTATANVFGHDRRADRAAEMLLGYDTFNGIPRHVRALDVGAIRSAGGLTSLHDAGEFYLLTEYAEGTVYAEDLRRIARDGGLVVRDVVRAEALASHLAAIHEERRGSPPVYRRSVRDLVGSGEGVAGIIDGYPDDVPGAPFAQLARIQEACTRWRWALRRHEHRCRRIHGDYHPFNVVFGEDAEPILLDASRGSAGDPADDVACMAINYVFFALEHPGAWRPAFSVLWDGFFRAYDRVTSDGGLLDVIAPYLAWRGLVVANPAWYPSVGAKAREAVLGFIEAALGASRFDPRSAGELFP
jgi:hypothetical protein